MHPIMHAFLHINPILIYLLVAVILLLESTGVPVINNTLLLLLGAMAALGNFNIYALIVSALVGSIAGACCAYWIGMRGGRKLVLRLARLLHVNEQRIDIMDSWFQKSGYWMIFLSRMTPYIRPFACFPAGIAHMNFKKFLLAASSGSLLWCIILPSIGWALGPHWKVALHLMQHYTLPTMLVVVLLVVAYLFGSSLLKRTMNMRYGKFASKYGH